MFFLYEDLNILSLLDQRPVKHTLNADDLRETERSWSLMAESVCWSSDIVRAQMLRGALISPSGHITVSWPDADPQSQGCLDSMATKAPKEPRVPPLAVLSELQNNESGQGIASLKFLQLSARRFWYWDLSLDLSSSYSPKTHPQNKAHPTA